MTTGHIGVKVNGEFFPITKEVIDAAIAVAEKYSVENKCIAAGVLATVGTQHAMMRMSKDGLIAGEKVWIYKKSDGGDIRKTNPALLAAFSEFHEILKKNLSGIELAARQTKAA